MSQTGLTLDSGRAMAGYVLIVESDAELQRQIGAALREAGFELHAEAEAAWAKRSVGTRVPDVVVVDTRLTDGDGFAFADELRQAPETRATPIVFVASTHRGVSHRAEARRRFAPADYLPTPLDLARLAPRVAELAARGAPTPPERRRPTPTRSRRRRRRRRACAIRPSSASAATSSAAPSAWPPIADDAELQGTLKRTPFARLLQRLYAKRATGSLLLLRDTDQEDRHLRRGLSGVGAVERARRDAGAHPAGEAADHQRGPGRVGRPHAEGEAPPGRDPGRDGGAVAVQPRTRAGRAGGGEAVRGVLVERRQVHVQGRRRRGRPEPRGWSARRRRRSSRASAGTTTKRASRRRWRSTPHQYVALDVGSGAAPAGHDVGSRRARVHPEHRRHATAGGDPRARARSRATRRACCWWRCRRRG